MNKTGKKNDNLQQSFRFCVESIKNNSKSFYYAFKKLPKEKFLGVAAIYAFCRAADDLADSPSSSESRSGQRESGAEETLKTLGELREYVTGRRESEEIKEKYPWWEAFSFTIGKYGIPVQAMVMQLEGQISDLSFCGMETMESLMEYSRNVAGSVGRMLLPILLQDPNDMKDEALLEAFEGLGIAMQITNILRDVGEDLKERNRIYLPVSLMKKYHLYAEDLQSFFLERRQLSFTRFIGLWEELAEAAETHYQRVEHFLLKVEKSCRLSLCASSYIYRRILEEVRSNEYNCFTLKNHTSRFMKFRLFLEAKARIGRLKYE